MASNDHRRAAILAGDVSVTKPGLSRVLGLRELVLYGIVLIQPTAPMPLYGVVCEQAKGHVVTTILIGMVAMLFTAISYGRMAQAYPSAGSAYTYVGRELHPCTRLSDRVGHDLRLRLEPDHLRDLVQQGRAELHAGCALRGLRRVLRGAFHLAEPARDQGKFAHQRDHHRGAGRGDRSVLRGRRAHDLPHARPWGRTFSAAFLRSGDVLLEGRLHRDVDRHAHVHWFRRNLDALGRGPQPAPKYSAGDRTRLPRDRSTGRLAGLRRAACLAPP